MRRLGGARSILLSGSDLFMIDSASDETSCTFICGGISSLSGSLPFQSILNFMSFGRFLGRSLLP